MIAGLKIIEIKESIFKVYNFSLVSRTELRTDEGMLIISEKLNRKKIKYKLFEKRFITETLFKKNNNKRIKIAIIIKKVKIINKLLFNLS